MKKKEAYYFSHDSNALYDDKILELRGDSDYNKSHGFEGYGLYWAINEAMRNATNFRLENKKIKSLSIALSYPADKLQKFIDKCVEEYNLYKRNDTYYWSESLLKRMKEKENKSKKMSENASKRWKQSNSNAIASDLHSESDALKEKKGKESKEKKTKKHLYIS